MTELIGFTAGALAVLGVVLNNHRLRACFIVWLVSNAITAGLHSYAGLWSLAVRDVIFFALAVHGWVKWGKKL